MNHLKNETSPYLKQHAENPVDWYSWGSEAFLKAKKENKPVFLSIGYSTCHWCHVMAHESFENNEVADILNKNFVSIKVDKEERPDIDSIYMQVCQAFTGSGGWPTSVFLTPDQTPIFAGTYYSKADFCRLANRIAQLWETQREELLTAGREIVSALSSPAAGNESVSNHLLDMAAHQFAQAFDEKNGGFGNSPKFPSPHNLLFLLSRWQTANDKQALKMAEKTLTQMYKGGLFDHIGFGFSRYSTDDFFLVPHFEKMLYDNALLMMAYITAFHITKNELFKDVAVKTATYVLREMTDPAGGFYSAQDADSDGEEGKFYTFTYEELTALLGEKNGSNFNEYFGITKEGNFEGKNIPNLLGQETLSRETSKFIPAVLDYRKKRTQLHLDDKILTAWNGLMICAFTRMYRAVGDMVYLETAKDAYSFIEQNLMENGTLFVSFRHTRSKTPGFLDDYANTILALISLYEATLEKDYLNKALRLTEKTADHFYDGENGGFFLYGADAEQLILRPKETYDGAMPSGNSVMAYNLVKLSQITQDPKLEQQAKRQLAFMSAAAEDYPMGYSFFLLALLEYLNPPVRIVCVRKDEDAYLAKFPQNAAVRLVDSGEEPQYPIINGRTTYYVCNAKSCLPPTNNLEDVL